MVQRRGLCMQSRKGAVTTYRLAVFNSEFAVVHSFALAGPSSRTRLSPDGRYGAATVFLAGHAYNIKGFSTATTLYDLDRGAELGNLESFKLFNENKQITPADANFWGVTFASDDDTFYATLGTGNHRYLVQGSLRS